MTNFVAAASDSCLKWEQKCQKATINHLAQVISDVSQTLIWFTLYISVIINKYTMLKQRIFISNSKIFINIYNYNTILNSVRVFCLISVVDYIWAYHLTYELL